MKKNNRRQEKHVNFTLKLFATVAQLAARKFPKLEVVGSRPACGCFFFRVFQLSCCFFICFFAFLFPPFLLLFIDAEMQNRAQRSPSFRTLRESRLDSTTRIAAPPSFSRDSQMVLPRRRARIAPARLQDYSLARVP